MKTPKRVQVVFRDADQPLRSQWEVIVHCSPDYRRIQVGSTPCGSASSNPYPQLALIDCCLPETHDRPCEWQVQWRHADGPALVASPCGETPRLQTTIAHERACCPQHCPGRLSIVVLGGRVAGGDILRDDCWHPMLMDKPALAPPLPRLPRDLWSVVSQSFAGAELERIHASIARVAHYRVARLARMVQVSERQLERIHQQAFGESPKTWLERFRRAEARLLEQEGFRGKECAERLGFSQRSHFCRWYREANANTKVLVARKMLKCRKMVHF